MSSSSVRDLAYDKNVYVLYMVVHTFYPSTWEPEAGGSLSTRTVRATQRKLGLKEKQNKKGNNKKE